MDNGGAANLGKGRAVLGEASGTEKKNARRHRRTSGIALPHGERGRKLAGRGMKDNAVGAAR